MKRKLVQMGKHCLMTAIPKKWLKHHHLGKGDSIVFEEVEQYLVVSPKPLPKDKSITIKINKANRTGLFRVLQLLYDSGYKTIKVNFDDSQTLNWLLWGVDKLEEWRIESVDENRCLIKTINIEKQEFPAYFRRIMLLTKELTHTYLKYLEGKDLLEDIRVKHKLILSGTQSIKRMINTSSLPLEYKYYYFIAIQLEEIADHYEYLSRNLEKMKRFPKELVILQSKLCQLFDQTYHNFYNFNLEWFIEFSKKETWKRFATEKNPLLVYHQRAISEKIKNIAKYTLGIRM